VQVFVVAPRAQRSIFEQALASIPGSVVPHRDEGEALRSVGVRRAPSGSSAKRCIFIRGEKAPREQFASSAERRRYQVWQLQRGHRPPAGTSASLPARCTPARNGRRRCSMGEAPSKPAATRIRRRAYERITAGFR